MGGKALEQFGAKRLTANEYSALNTEVQVKLAHVFSQSKGFTLLPAYREKASHGDIDFLCHSLAPDDFVKIVKALRSAPGSDAPSTINGDVFSVLYKTAQIDFIMVPKEKMQMAYLLYSHNGAGILLGRIFRAFGLKLSIDGLYTYLNPEDKSNDSKYIISSSPREICESIGLSYDFFKMDLVNPQAIYEALFRSPYCLLENLLPKNEEQKKNQEEMEVLEGVEEYVRNAPQGSYVHKPRLNIQANFSANTLLFFVLSYFGVREGYLKRKKEYAKTVSFKNVWAKDTLMGMVNSGQEIAVKLNASQYMGFTHFLRISVPDFEKLSMEGKHAELVPKVKEAFEIWFSTLTDAAKKLARSGKAVTKPTETQAV